MNIRLQGDEVALMPEIAAEVTHAKPVRSAHPACHAEKALLLLQNEVLSVYDKLGDVRSLLIGRTKLAILLWQRDRAGAAGEVSQLLCLQLLCLALEDAHRLRIPEAGVIEKLPLRLKMSCGD